jgi:predicted dithiol-disulfide oxidoreductase (DUF899 family)
MPKHDVGTREEWKTAVEAVHERELGRLDDEIAKQRQEVPWVRVEKDYVFGTEAGKRALPELFEGQSRLLIYHLMYGPTYDAACAGCTGLADHFDGALPHLNARDITLIAISRAPIEKLKAYKRRMGWKFPYVSSYGNDFNLDLDFAFTDEQMAHGELKKMVDEADDWLKDWADDVGTKSGATPSRGAGLERLQARGRRRLPHVLPNPATVSC